MTRKSWEIYLSDKSWKRDEVISIHSAREILLDWKNETEIINKKLNWLMDEIFKLNKEINE